jgi:two-component system nitrogen regulation response regulator GlnG
METKPLAFIVEDNEDQNLVFTTALHYAGYETESFVNGLAVQQRLNEVTPEVMVLDLHLPGVNGESLLHLVRSEHRLRNVRVILATADASLANDLQPQADLVLLKPISFSQLNKLSERFLGKTKPLNDLPLEPSD